MEPLSAGLASIGSLGTSLINSLQAKRNTDLTIKANKELADYQYQKNLESWHLQNAYNTPSEQMKRFKEAGLNPNLIYGQGNSGNAQAISSYQAPKVDYQYKAPIDPMAMLGTYMSFRKEMANTQTAEAQAKYAEQLAREKAKTADWTSDKVWADAHIQTMIKEAMGGTFESNTPKGEPTPWQQYFLDAMKLSNANKAQDTELKKAQQSNIEYRNKELDQRTQLLKKEVDNFLLKMWSGIGLNTANTLLKFK